MNNEDWYKMTERPEERELRRKKRHEAAWQWVGAILSAIVGVVLFLLYLDVTPRQSSAINDLEEADAAARHSETEARP